MTNFNGQRIARVSSTLTRVSDTNAYVQNDLIATNVTAGSVVVPSLSMPRGSGSYMATLRRVVLTTTKTSGMGSFQGFIEFWSAAPTFTNGDNGAYAVATGAANYLGVITTTVMVQVADGAYCVGVPTTGLEFNLASVPSLYWSLKEADATGFTPASAQPFVLTAELQLG